MVKCCNCNSIDCCDMRGLLSFMILWLLTKRDMYGQELASEIENRKGSKPNPGTLYPALDQLVKNGVVVARQEGRKKVYHITDEGKRSAVEACQYFCRVYGDIFREYNQV